MVLYQILSSFLWISNLTEIFGIFLLNLIISFFFKIFWNGKCFSNISCWEKTEIIFHKNKFIWYTLVQTLPSQNLPMNKLFLNHNPWYQIPFPQEYKENTLLKQYNVSTYKISFTQSGQVKNDINQSFELHAETSNMEKWAQKIYKGKSNLSSNLPWRTNLKIWKNGTSFYQNNLCHSTGFPSTTFE